MGFLIVFIGSGIGGVLRHGVGLAVLRLYGPSFPTGTLIINIAGSALMGAVVGVLAARGVGDAALRLFLMTGIIGGFTTFSTFSLDVVALYERGQVGAAFLYATTSVLGGVLALFAAMLVVRHLNSA